MTAWQDKAARKPTILIYDDSLSELTRLREDLMRQGYRVVALMAYPTSVQKEAMLHEGIDGSFASFEELAAIVKNPQLALKRPTLPAQVDLLISDLQLGSTILDEAAYKAYLQTRPQQEQFRVSAKGPYDLPAYQKALEEWSREGILDHPTIPNPRGSELVKELLARQPGLPAIIRTGAVESNHTSLLKMIDHDLGEDFPRVGKHAALGELLKKMIAESKQRDAS